MLGLYIHIPFCVKKCSYCDFYSLPSRQDTIEPYVQAVLREAKSYSNTDCHLESFHRRTKNLIPSPSFLRRDLKGEFPKVSSFSLDGRRPKVFHVSECIG